MTANAPPAASATPTRNCRRCPPRASSLRQNRPPVPLRCCQLSPQKCRGLPTQPYRWLSGAGQQSLTRRQTDRSNGPHLNSKSNALTEHGNDLLSRPDVGLVRQTFMPSRPVSQNAVPATQNSSAGQRRLKLRENRCWQRHREAPRRAPRWATRCARKAPRSHRDRANASVRPCSRLRSSWCAGR